MAKSANLDQVMSWNPCENFPPGRIVALFAGRKAVTINDFFDIDMRQDEQLWGVLREHFFPPEVLEKMAARFVLHVRRLARHGAARVEQAYLNALFASVKNFEALPEDKRQDHWKSGATDAEKCVALTGLWAATARANTVIGHVAWRKLWNKERDWQVLHVKKKASQICQASMN